MFIVDLELVDATKVKATIVRRMSMTGNGKKIPRPLNAFMLFANDTRAEFRKKYPKEKNNRISVKLGEAWKELSGHEKTRYYKLSKKLEIEHRHKYPNYTYCPNEARTKKRNRLEQRLTGFHGKQPKSNSQDLHRSRSSEAFTGAQRQLPLAPPRQGYCSHWPSLSNSSHPWHIGQGDHVFPMPPMYGAHCYHSFPYCDYRQMPPTMYPHYNGMMPPYMPQTPPRLMYPYPQPPPFAQISAHQDQPMANRADGHLQSLEAFANSMTASVDNFNLPPGVSGSIQPMAPDGQHFSNGAPKAEHCNSHASTFNEMITYSGIHNLEALQSAQSQGSTLIEMTENPGIHNMEAVNSVHSHGSAFNDTTTNFTIHSTEAPAYAQNHGATFNEFTTNPHSTRVEAETSIQSLMTTVKTENSMDNIIVPTSVQPQGSMSNGRPENSQSNNMVVLTSVESHMNTSEMPGNSQGKNLEIGTTIHNHGSMFNETGSLQAIKMEPLTSLHNQDNTSNGTHGINMLTSVQSHDSTLDEGPGNSQNNMGKGTTTPSHGSRPSEMAGNPQANNKDPSTSIQNQMCVTHEETSIPEEKNIAVVTSDQNHGKNKMTEMPFENDIDTSSVQCYPSMVEETADTNNLETIDICPVDTRIQPQSAIMEHVN